jgi:pyruvate/2-oxoglutarate dehydrogenase complex dihydrolipoamide acyltransferase (E2) component
MKKGKRECLDLICRPPHAPHTLPFPHSPLSLSLSLSLHPQVAAETGVDLAAIAKGTGPNGRIVAADVKEFVPPARAAAAAPAAAASAAAPAAAAAAPAATSSYGDARSGFVDIPHSQMRRVIAHRLTASKQVRE